MHDDNRLHGQCRCNAHDMEDDMAEDINVDMPNLEPNEL